MKIEIRADNSVHIEGYVNAVERDSNIINVPSVGRCVEQIRAGVFDKALSSGADVSILENHDNSRRLGSISEGNLKLYEDNIGLRASADITDIEIVGKARRGELKGWSFGFICTDSEIEQRSGNVPRRIVKGMTLSEVSLIDGDYKPCYNGTLVEVRSEGNFIEYRAGIDENVEVNTPTESADTSTDAENAPVDSTADGETVENRSETPDYSYYDAMLRYLELRYNPYHDPGNGRFTSGGGGGGGSVLVIPEGHKGVYTGYKKAMQKSISSASDLAAERVKAMGGYVDEYGNFSFAEHGGLKMIADQTGAAPSATIDLQTGNVASQATNSSGGLTNGQNSNTIKSNSECKNHEQLAAYWKGKYGVTIDKDVSDLNFEATKRALTGVESVIQEYPDVGNTLQTIGCKKSGVMCCSGESLYFNPNYFKGENAETQLNNMCKESSNIKWWPSNSSIESIGAHEMGHAVEKTLVRSNPTNYSPVLKTMAWNSSTESKAIVSQACKNVKKTEHGKGKTNGELIGSISRYSDKGGKSETFAESFADVFANGTNAQPLSKEIVKLAKNKFVEYKGVK